MYSVFQSTFDSYLFVVVVLIITVLLFLAVKQEMETTSLLEGNSCEMFESLRTSDSKANCRVVNIDGDHTSLRRHRMRLDESDIKERQSTEVRKDDGREGLESESDIEEGGSEEEGNSEGVEIMEEEGSGREGGERGIGDKEASGSMNSTMLSLNGRLENYMPPKRNLQISPESEVSNVESNDSFGKFDLGNIIIVSIACSHYIFITVN